MRTAPGPDGIVRVNRSAHVRFQPAIGRRGLARAELIGLGAAIGNITAPEPARSGWRWLWLAIPAGCVLGLLAGAGVESVRWW